MVLFKMLCIDIDGTLIDDNKEVSITAKQEIIRIITIFNTQLILVSSRMPLGIDQIATKLSVNQPIVCYNGALVLGKVKNGSREVMYSETIPLRIVENILYEIDINTVYVGIYRNDDWIIQNSNYWSEREAKSTNCKPTEMKFETFFNIQNLNKSGVHKIMLREHQSILDGYEKMFRLKFADMVAVHRIKDTVLEITPYNVTKADAIKFLSNMFGVMQNEIIAIGDNYNDKELFEFAGTSIAMENSPEDLKNLATDVTASNNEDGVSKALIKYFKDS
jgi:Cof subfamily protein (haloacid dehalogenase superfamily)